MRLLVSAWTLYIREDDGDSEFREQSSVITSGLSFVMLVESDVMSQRLFVI